MMRAETRQSTAAAAQPPASEPPPPKPNFEPEDRPKKEPTKPEAFLARQRQLGSLGGSAPVVLERTSSWWRSPSMDARGVNCGRARSLSK